MSGLSANTSSCGGDGGLLGLGGETTGGGKAVFVAFLLVLKMEYRGGANFWISLSECSDRSLLSESSAIMGSCVDVFRRCTLRKEGGSTKPEIGGFKQGRRIVRSVTVRY